jgi:hypothetical protein
MIVAGTAGGAGTAMWLSGKLTQEVNAPLERTVSAAKSALQSMGLAITKEAATADVAQIKSVYTDGKTIWIDIRRLTGTRSKVEVRVGAVHPDQEISGKIVEKIQNYL